MRSECFKRSEVAFLPCALGERIFPCKSRIAVVYWGYCESLRRESRGCDKDSRYEKYQASDGK